jgi:hypothetical protein
MHLIASSLLLAVLGFSHTTSAQEPAKTPPSTVDEQAEKLGQAATGSAHAINDTVNAIGCGIAIFTANPPEKCGPPLLPSPTKVVDGDKKN